MPPNLVVIVLARTEQLRREKAGFDTIIPVEASRLGRTVEQELGYDRQHNLFHGASFIEVPLTHVRVSRSPRSWQTSLPDWHHRLA
jgi:hypothetical protein